MARMINLSPDRRDALELRYDGPIPQEAIEQARHLTELERAAGQRLMYAAAIRRQIRTIRSTRRIAGTQAHVAALINELRVLRLYWRGANRSYQAVNHMQMAAE